MNLKPVWGSLAEGAHMADADAGVKTYRPSTPKWQKSQIPVA